MNSVGEMMPGSESDCDSLDSGLETGNSNLETSENFLESEETDSATESYSKREVSESPLSDLRSVAGEGVSNTN